MDTLLIKSLKVSTRIGVHDWEQQISQKLLIDISIPRDFLNCQDELSKTIDYQALCTAATQYMEQQSFQLIESVANELALFLKDKFNLQTITLTVYKPQAIHNAACVSVSATR